MLACFEGTWEAPIARNAAVGCGSSEISVFGSKSMNMAPIQVALLPVDKGSVRDNRETLVWLER